MGRIGKSYPRFEELAQAAQRGGSARRKRFSDYQIAGAIAGILAALGLIGWLLSR